MDKVKKIRKEIERLHGNPYYMMAIRNVLSIIDSLQEEPVSEELEAEIKKMQRHYRTIEEYDGHYVSLYASDIEHIARHFAEWGKNHIVDNNEMVSEELEEAAEKYSCNASNIIEWSDGWEDFDDRESVERAFEAGAEWMLNKINKEENEKNRD